WSDTLHTSVALTPQPGMIHRIQAPHATCMKMVDSANGWAGFGYWATVPNPETGKDTTFKITQYARRTAHGWDASPKDMENADVPPLTLDALDDQTAWFAGTAPNGSSQIMGTSDGELPFGA